MELEQLRTFIAVAEKGSFSKAAKELFVSHSTTSRVVSALEEELGVKLFYRDNRVFGLTDAGKLLLERGKELLSHSEAVKNEIRGMKKT